MRKFALLIGVIVLCLPAWGQSFRAVVNKRQVSLGETVQVFFEINNLPEGQIAYPNLEEDFQILGGPNRSQQVSIVNNQVSQTTSWYFYLTPKKAGTYLIGSATYKTPDKTFRTSPLKIEVSKGNKAPNNPATARPNNARSNPNAGIDEANINQQLKDLIFIKAFPSKRKVYQGEQLTVTYKLYVKRGVRVRDISPTTAPKYNGFWVEELETGNAQLRPDEYNGEAFDAAVVKKVILFPQKSGTLSIDPFGLESVVQVRVNSRRSQSIFDSFFPSYQNVPFSFASNTIKLEVEPLPRIGRPADFKGVVGTFKLDVSLDSTEAETGEAITLRVKINGKGNLQSVREPVLDFPPDFDVYDAQVSDKISRNSGLVSGSKSFDYLIIPRNPGQFKLPRVRFSYFDIAKGEYVTLRGPELDLTVTGEPQAGSPSSANPSVGTKEDLALMNQEIRFIQTDPGKLRPIKERFAGSGWFFAMYLLPFLTFGFLFFYKRKKDAAAADIAGTRMRKANKVATKRLKAADKLRQDQDAKGFYDEVVRAFWGYLGDKLRLSPSALSRENISEALQAKQVNENLIGQLSKILDTCEMALFSPLAQDKLMDSTYEQSVALITQMEKEIVK